MLELELDDDPAPAALPEPAALLPPDWRCVSPTAAAPVPCFSTQSFGSCEALAYLVTSQRSSFCAVCLAFLSFCPELVAVLPLALAEPLPLNEALAEVVSLVEDEPLVEELSEPLALELEGEVVLAEEGPGDAMLDDDGVEPELDEGADCVVVAVPVVGDFLLSFLSPSARAEPLASATIVVNTKAGASLRI